MSSAGGEPVHGSATANKGGGTTTGLLLCWWLCCCGSVRCGVARHPPYLPTSSEGPSDTRSTQRVSRIVPENIPDVPAHTTVLREMDRVETMCAAAESRFETSPGAPWHWHAGPTTLSIHKPTTQPPPATLPMITPALHHLATPPPFFCVKPVRVHPRALHLAF